MRKDDKHGRWDFGISGQKQYRNDLGQVPGYDKFAEDKKESSEEMFSFTSCAIFFVA